jgi:glycosyltransferase involved in cell wall biosynthesis
MRDLGRPLRVVQVSFHADHQGRDAETLLDAWPTLSSVAEGVARAGVTLTVVQTAHNDQTIRRGSVEFHFVKDTAPERRRVARRVAELGPDVVHVHGLHHGRAVRRLTRPSRRAPVLVQDHGNIEPRGWRRVALMLAFRSVDAAAFTVRDQAAPWIACGVLGQRLPVFDVLEGSSRFTPGDQQVARREAGVFGDPCVLWTSHLDANKDPLMMLDTIERAAPRLKDLRVWCCFGAAPLLREVKTRIATSDLLRSRVALLGTRPRDEMERLFRAADFYIQTSHRESTGFSLLEAMSCGTPPIATDIPPTRWIVGDTGSLTPVGNSILMSDALVAFATRDQSSLRAAVRARFERSLTFDAIGQQLRGAYETLVDARRS